MTVTHTQRMSRGCPAYTVNDNRQWCVSHKTSPVTTTSMSNHFKWKCSRCLVADSAPHLNLISQRTCLPQPPQTGSAYNMWTKTLLSRLHSPGNNERNLNYMGLFSTRGSVNSKVWTKSLEPNEKKINMKPGEAPKGNLQQQRALHSTPGCHSCQSDTFLRQRTTPSWHKIVRHEEGRKWIIGSRGNQEQTKPLDRINPSPVPWFIRRTSSLSETGQQQRGACSLTISSKDMFLPCRTLRQFVCMHL